MKRWAFLQVVLIFSSVFMVIQLLIWAKFSSKEIGEPNPSRVKEVIKSFLNVWDNNQAKVFLMDPDILMEYMEDKLQGLTCGSLCQSQKKLITFGVIGNVQRSLRPVFHKLRSYNFAVVDSIDEFPDKVGDNSIHVTSHVFLQDMKYPEPTIHVLVMYERAGEFLWHSKIQVASSDLKFGYEAGSYKKFDLESAVIDGISLYIPKPVNKFLDSVMQSKYIECDGIRAESFKKAYPPDNSKRAKHFQRKARQLIAQGKDVFDKLGLRFWISSGTLLGWYRQCDIITHAQDVDFGMWIKDYDPQLIPEMEKAGLPLKHLFGRVNDTFELSFQAGDIKLDIFFFYEELDHMWNGGTDVKNGAKLKYVFPKFSLCWTTLLDLLVRVPCPTLPYIEANYGKGWFTPVKDWNWKDSPTNVQKNGFWPQDQWESVMQMYE
ncbi:ribitol-5-phosphate transferase FKTN-like [Ylistrum balloti]|uniref:ribitol-5-phosphate transferase FKTN-like n=1 Tax=Ylistrum balloti TaxID=509963 RepID=UPI002905B6B6|nr:ribitol-5-phosphate transferase FKTN-like [Ylistrum balloti]